MWSTQRAATQVHSRCPSAPELCAGPEEEKRATVMVVLFIVSFVMRGEIEPPSRLSVGFIVCPKSFFLLFGSGLDAVGRRLPAEPIETVARCQSCREVSARGMCRRYSEGGMIWSETLLELKFLNLSCSILTSSLKLDKQLPVEQFEASRAIRGSNISVSSTLPPVNCVLWIRTVRGSTA